MPLDSEVNPVTAAAKNQQHDFRIVTFHKLTWCKLDNDLIYGLVKQGARCRHCRLTVHRRCVAKVQASPCELLAPQNSAAHRAQSTGGKHKPHLTETTCDSSDDEILTSKCSNTSNNRLRAVHPGLSIKQRMCAILREGWMSYHTSLPQSACNRKQLVHFWKLSTKELSIYDDPNVIDPLIIIPMDSIIAVEENNETAYAASHPNAIIEQGSNDELISDNGRQNLAPVKGISGQCPHVFTIRTPKIVVYAGQDPSYFEKTSDWNELNKGIGRAYGLGWMNTIRQLCFSLPAANSQDIDIRDLYDVDPENPDCILGSGQFGIVYAGKARPPANDQQVAIKAIDKKQLASLDKLSVNQFIASEIRIMKEIKHPGIVKLVECINATEKIYVVMEKAHTDLLDYILNHPNSRLSERTTKFITKQVLVALKYLHTAHRMAHCDLKPENILLVFHSSTKRRDNSEEYDYEQDEFPLVKLADFGYSRIIGDHSFRASIVGTPAYLPPEIMAKTPLFNKELDSWSLGVVIFVCLSGVFPYNSDDEEVVRGLQKIPIYFADDPWKKLTPEATGIVQQLMEVNVRQRATPAKALKHDWFSKDYQAWCDIRVLETRVTLDRITTESNSSGNSKAKRQNSNSLLSCSQFFEWTTADEEKQWEAYRQANGLPQWQQIGCK